MRPHAALDQPMAPLHAFSKHCGASSLPAAPADITQLHSTVPGLSIRTSKKQQQDGTAFASGSGQVDALGIGQRPRSRANTPHRLITGTPLHDLLLRDDSSFITDGAMDALQALSWNQSGDLGGFIKQEPCSPGLAGLAISLPNTSTLASFMHGGSGFAQAFGQQPQLTHAALRPALPDPVAVQKFLDTAAQLKRRAEALWEAEDFELQRAAKLRILQQPAGDSNPGPMPVPNSATTKLLDSFPYPLSRDANLLGSPGSLALMSCLQPQFLSSPVHCFAEVRLLDSAHNTPSKFGCL